MKIIQNSYCATYGPDDSLLADVDTIQQYAGKSALTAIDTLDIIFTGRQLWRPNRTGREFIASITLRDHQPRNVSESFFCSLSR